MLVFERCIESIATAVFIVALPRWQVRVMALPVKRTCAQRHSKAGFSECAGKQAQENSALMAKKLNARYSYLNCDVNDFNTIQTGAGAMVCLLDFD
jgi:hypothetical protein